MAFDTLCFLPFLSRREKRDFFLKTNLDDKIHFFLNIALAYVLFYRWVLPLIPCEFKATCVVFTTRHKKVTTNPRDTIFWITDHNFFSHERFSTETGLYLRFLTHKKIIKIEGQRCPFEPPNRGWAMKFKRNWKP